MSFCFRTSEGSDTSVYSSMTRNRLMKSQQALRCSDRTAQKPSINGLLTTCLSSLLGKPYKQGELPSKVSVCVRVGGDALLNLVRLKACCAFGLKAPRSITQASDSLVTTAWCGLTRRVHGHLASVFGMKTLSLHSLLSFSVAGAFSATEPLTTPLCLLVTNAETAQNVN